MTNQQGAPEALPDPSPDQLRAISRTARNSSGSASDDCGPLAYVLHGWRAAVIAFRAHQAALVEAQQPAAHVQNPAEIEHVAGDVSKNGPESNTAQQAAPSAAAADPCPGCIPGGYCRTPKCGRLAALNAAPQPSPTPQADSAPAAAPADTVVFEAALRAIHQAIDLIGEPDTERLRTVRRVLRGAVVVAEDSKAPQADSASAARRPDLVPGVMHCAKCKFQLNRVTLCVSDGNAYAGNNKTEPCPNGCGPLWPVTWEQEARNCWKALEEMHERLRPAPTPQADSQPAPVLDMAVMQLAESVGLIGPASRTHDLHAAIQRFHDLICANATIKAAAMAAEVISGAQADSVLEDAEKAEKAEKALRKVLGVVQRYLPPDGPSIQDAMSEIIAIVDPWPLGQLEKS